MESDPAFLSGPNGAYYLSQIAAGQSVNSPCPDAGDPSTDPWGWNLSTTRTDEIPDSGTVDMGYHYPLPCTDNDEDLYAIEGGVCGEIDCDDSNPEVNPGMPETPNNGVDDDCDPSTPDQPPWGAATSAEASQHIDGSPEQSVMLNSLVVLFLPAGLVVLVRLSWRTGRRDDHVRTQ